MKSILSASILLLFLAPVRSQSSLTIIQTVDSCIVLFDFGSAALRPEADSALQRLAASWRKDSSLWVRITAHTDAIGSTADNEGLSRQRAAAIEAKLQSLGLPLRVFQTEAFGEKKPLADNNTDKGRQLNRRATVELLSAKPSFELRALIVDEKTGKGVESRVLIHIGDTYLDTIQTNRAGGFSYKLPLETEVQFDIFTPGYFVETKTITTQTAVKRLRFPVRPALAGERINLKYLYFVTDEATLLPRSEPELQKLLTFMRLNPGIRVEIAGHMSYTDAPPVPKDSWQFELSYSRARMVHDFLIDNGIAPERLSFKGYGNWEMRFPSADREAEHRENRRVELRVLE